MDQKVKWKEGRRSNVGRREVMMIPLRLVAPGGPADDGKRVGLSESGDGR